MLPPLSFATMIRRSGRGSDGPMISPVRSCRKVSSPSRACTPPSVTVATPTAVETVPSMPESPRLAKTTGGDAETGARSRSRIGEEDPTTKVSPAASVDQRPAASAGPER